jgi:microcystin-dependent protein
MELIQIVVILLVFIVLYLVYKTRNMEKLSIEKFETDLISAVNNKYTADVDAIRNLSSLANTILTNRDSFRVPATTTLMNNLVVDGTINFINKDTVMLEIFPKYMVISWANVDIPLGWAICDGKKYILDASNKAVEDITGQITPDLRGRFILGSGFGAKDMNDEFLTERTIGEVGGEEGHILTELEMPAHDHKYSPFRLYHNDYSGDGVNVNSGDWRLKWENNQSMFDSGVTQNHISIRTTLKKGGQLRNQTGNLKDGADKNYNIDPIWDITPHNNMPPFYVLTYIMKL